MNLFKKYGVLFAIGLLILGAGIYKLSSRKDTSSRYVNDAVSSDVSEEKTNTNSEATNVEAPKTDVSCSGALTKAETEGPYYTAGSPAKSDFTVDDPNGEIITISGYVFDANCKPIANAYLDLWHANSAGEYDNSGYKLRGHFQADQNGYYSVKTIMAGKYPGRTEHWHIKIARDSSLNNALTTQLFPPGGQSQEGDSIFDSSLLVQNFKQNDSRTERTASFNFVIQ